MIAGGLIAAPIFILQPELVRVMAVVVGLVILSQILSKNSYKNNLLGELTLFLLMGPALVAGYQVSLGAGIDAEVLAFGILWGTVAVFLIHINNFSHLVTSSQARIKNSMTTMGFDRSRQFIFCWWLMMLILWILFHWFFTTELASLMTAIIALAISVPFLNQLIKIKSPLGSDLLKIRVESLAIVMSLAFMLLVEFSIAVGTKLTWIH